MNCCIFRGVFGPNKRMLLHLRKATLKFMLIFLVPFITLNECQRTSTNPVENSGRISTLVCSKRFVK